MAIPGPVRGRARDSLATPGVSPLRVSIARSAGCSGTLMVRMDSAFYGAPACSAAGPPRRGAFVGHGPHGPKVRAAIAAIAEHAWTPTRYPRAVWDDQLGRWVSDAQVAETEYTAFTSRKGQAITARLIVRRVKDLNRKAAAGQGELFAAWRYHALFTGRSYPSAETSSFGVASSEPQLAKPGQAARPLARESSPGLAGQH